MEVSLKDLIKENERFNSLIDEHPNGSTIDLGSLIIIIIDTAWGWLAADGQVQPLLFNRDVPIHHHIMTTMQSLLQVDSNSIEGKSKRAIIVITPCELFPTNIFYHHHHHKEYNEPQMFKITDLDRNALITMITKWQQDDVDRTVLLISANDNFATEGIVFPSAIVASLKATRARAIAIENEKKMKNDTDIYDDDDDALNNDNDDDDANNNNDDDDNIDEGNDSAGWDENRSQINHIVVGQMDKRSKAMSKVRLGLGSEASPSSGFIYNKEIGFVGEYNSLTSCPRRCYWDTIILPSTKPYLSGGGWVTGKPARIINKCNSDWKKTVNVTLGPVIGRVTATSATILLESSDGGHVEMLCIDQITGVEYSCSCLMQPHRPSVFTFDNLVPERPYDVVLSGPSIFDEANIWSDSRRSDPNPNPSFIRGTFTTHRRIGWSIDDDQRIGIYYYYYYYYYYY